MMTPAISCPRCPWGRVLTSLWMMRNVLERPEDQPLWRPLLLGGLVGWTALIRTEAVILFPSLIVGFAWTKRWRALAQVLGIALVIWGGVMVRNLLKTGH